MAGIATLVVLWPVVHLALVARDEHVLFDRAARNGSSVDERRVS